ncbi:hypothetical protein AB0M39_06295 [Streptomyces sp. NPDC051907]|uniref:hypothetical protein n=1 Tax=Streptomyces sp. NPDC051907 TaxID=3155284 RepID=UPI003418BC0D
MIKRLGFFREFDPQNTDLSAPSIHDAVRPTGPQDEAGLVAYLASGTEIFSAMGAERDVMTGDAWIPGAGSLVTDGAWLWPHELSHYVERYHAQLPEEFSALVRAARYSAPPVPRHRIEEIFQEVFGSSPSAARSSGATDTDGFCSWYLSDLTPQISALLLQSLEASGLTARNPLTGDVFVSRAAVAGGPALPVHDPRDLAAVLADPGDGGIAVRLWLAYDTSAVARVRRLEGTTAVVVHDLAGLREPERELVVEALVRSFDQLRDDCREFVVDLDMDWERSSPSSPR